MKRNLLLIVISLLVMSLNAQIKTKIVKVEDKETSKLEVYTVIKNDKTIKHGEYNLYLINHKAVTGNYNHNQKSGIWTYYSWSGEIDMKYDFETDRVVYFPALPDTSEYDRPALYFGSTLEITNLIRNIIEYPERALENGISGKVIIAILINEKGEVSGYEFINRVSPDLDEEAMRVVKLLPLKFIPAIKDGQPTTFLIQIPINFKLG